MPVIISVWAIQGDKIGNKKLSKRECKVRRKGIKGIQKGLISKALKVTVLGI